MADSENDYSSSDDSDYVPEGGSDSESDEDVQEDNGDGERQEGKKKQPKKDAAVNRKQKGGIKLEDEEDVKNDGLDEDEEKELLEERKMLEEERLKAKEAEEEEKQKKKADDLWSSFLSDVGQRPKASSSKTEVTSKAPEGTSKESKREVEKNADTSVKASGNQEMVTVTKVFDFAGEEVKVSENVKVNSQEAEALLQKPDKPSTKLDPPQPPLGIKRKPGGVGSLLSKLNKKPKMSVLEKSKLDWDSFKRKEGIEEDLKIHNKGKDGFLQKQDFLMETDLRQYEIERKLRMGQSGR